MIRTITATVLVFAGLQVHCQEPYMSHLLLCSDIDLSGWCISFPYVSNASQCITVPGAFNDLVSSAAPEGSGHNCTLYSDIHCTGTNYTITSYVDHLTNFNDELSSFQCSS